jgi:hypothetical protein
MGSAVTLVSAALEKEEDMTGFRVAVRIGTSIVRELGKNVGSRQRRAKEEVTVM